MAIGSSSSTCSLRTTARITIIRDIIRCSSHLKDRAIKVSEIIIIDKQPIRGPTPRVLARLNIESQTSVSGDGVDLVEERVRGDENAVQAGECDFNVQVVVHHVHAVPGYGVGLVGGPLLRAWEGGVCGGEGGFPLVVEFVEEPGDLALVGAVV